MPFRQADDASPPDRVVKLIFIHHSTGENWLADDYGDLGKTLSENNYFVSDTNYGWGPDAIGDRTDIPNWMEWFAGENTSTYMNALFKENEQHASYTRTLTNPGGENEIVMFKSCFPNSALEGNPNDLPDPEGWLSVGHAKFVYNEILKYFAARPEKLFVVITAPPLSDSTYAENARAFNNWLLNDWLKENHYTLNNVVVFDFYNVLTNPKAHHWVNNGQVEHVSASRNTLYYPSGDDHPSVKGSQKATDEFVPLLNVFYHRWKIGQPIAVSTQAAAVVESTQPSQEVQLQTSTLIDDFEQGSPSGTSGWEFYFQDDTDTTLKCAQDSSRANHGANSLKFEFDVAGNSWASCGIYFDSVMNWSGGQGISFYMQSSGAGIPFDVNLFGGTPGARSTYVYHAVASQESTNDWALVQINWDEILRSEWEENPGTQFDPAEVTGFAIGLSTPENSRISGNIWIDDLSTMGDDVLDLPVVSTLEPAVNVTQETDPAPVTAQSPLCNGLGAFSFFIFGLIFWQRRIRQ
ncbi:MAG: hypothetical protein HZB50_13910 [Chloroflexi bacterium]|nr:hypothetical protein [Chloroflexota bacterium]